MIQQVAGAIGIAVMVSLLSARQANELAGGAQQMDATALGATVVFIVGLALAIINFILSLFLKKQVSIKLKN